MATIQHRDINDPEIHEPKGISSALSDTLYVANGSGSGEWKKPTVNVISPEGTPVGVFPSCAAGNLMKMNKQFITLTGSIGDGRFGTGGLSGGTRAVDRTVTINGLDLTRDTIIHAWSTGGTVVQTAPLSGNQVRASQLYSWYSVGQLNPPSTVRIEGFTLNVLVLRTL